MAKTPRVNPLRTPAERPGRTDARYWDGAVFLVPLGSGLAVNTVLGWWSGLAAFLLAGVAVGVAAYRAGRRMPPRSPAERR